MQLEASWRSGYAEDCKSLYGGSIPSEASIKINNLSATSRTENLASGFSPLAAEKCVRATRPTKPRQGRDRPRRLPVRGPPDASL
jgi:hypothetical protein